MKFVALNFVVFVILAHAVLWAQQPGNGSPDTLAFENGSIKDNLYTNECFGFSLSLPAGWQLNAKVIGADGKAKHAAGQLILFCCSKQHKKALREIESFSPLATRVVPLRPLRILSPSLSTRQLIPIGNTGKS